MSWLTRSRPRAMFFRVAAMVPVLWGTFAFGAVYQWAYVPLAYGCGGVGIMLLILERRGRPPLKALAAGMALIALGVSLQLVTLPTASVARISPAAASFDENYKTSYGVLGAATDEQATQTDRRTFSIAPDKTWMGLFLFAALALFLLGVT